MDDEVNSTPVPEPTPEPVQETEPKPEPTEAVAATPAADLPAEASTEAGAMPERPSPFSVSSEPEAAQPAENFQPTPSASGAGSSAPAPQTNLSELRQKANAKRTARREMRLQQILSFASTNSNFSNQDVRDFLHVSQSSATNYLSELVKQGKLKVEGRARAARYSL